MNWEAVLIPLVKISIVFAVINPTILYLVLAERWVAAWLQDRVGPNRIGPLGLGHAVVDAVKLLFKEDVIPLGVDRPIYMLAPVIILIPAFCTIAAIPFADRIDVFGTVTELQIAENLNVGALYILSVASLGVYGVVLAGWGSNSKYAFLGGLRSAAQLISYEVPLGLSLLGIVLLAGSLELGTIVERQTGTWFGFLPKWNIFVQPMAFVVFLTCTFAETNRAPFDVAEAEQELVAGYHTEYSSMKWVMFFLAEYANMIVSSALMTCLFLGGWHFPYLAEPAGPAGDPWWMGLIKVAVICTKIGVLIFLFMWVRWTLPRFRFDQVMTLAWKSLVPIALVNLIAVGLTIWAAATPEEPDSVLPSRVSVVLVALNVIGFLLVLYVIPLLTRTPERRRPGGNVVSPLGGISSTA